MTTFRQFVMCETPAVHRIEGYSARGGCLHGSLDMVVYACADHLEQARAELHGLTEYASSPANTPPTCGEILDFRDVQRARGQAKQVDDDRPLHELDYAQRVAAPSASVTMKPAEVADNVIPAAALAELARALEFAGLPQLAARARAIVSYLGYVAESLDQVRADLTMLAAHAPDVQVPARATGEQLLEVVEP
ncbi:hypothetical protein ACW9HF_14985 [Nocardia gipuzkoensis]